MRPEMSVKTVRNPAYDHPFGAIVGIGRVHLSRCRDCGQVREDLRHQRRLPVEAPEPTQAADELLAVA